MEGSGSKEIDPSSMMILDLDSSSDTEIEPKVIGSHIIDFRSEYYRRTISGAMLNGGADFPPPQFLLLKYPKIVTIQGAEYNIFYESGPGDTDMVYLESNKGKKSSKNKDLQAEDLLIRPCGDIAEFFNIVRQSPSPFLVRMTRELLEELSAGTTAASIITFTPKGAPTPTDSAQ